MHERAVTPFPHDAAKSGYQFSPRRSNFVVMMKRQLAENLLAFGGEREQNFAAIILSAAAVYKPSCFQPVHQLHRAVMLDLHAIRQFANPRTYACRHALDRKHELVLTALQACVLHYLLAEVEKAANLETKLRQRLVVRQSELLH